MLELMSPTHAGANNNNIYIRFIYCYSFVFIDRLQLTPQGDLFVGPARLLKTGLSKNFCLTGRDVKTKEEALKRKPSRVHVTRWFADM